MTPFPGVRSHPCCARWAGSYATSRKEVDHIVRSNGQSESRIPARANSSSRALTLSRTNAGVYINGRPFYGGALRRLQDSGRTTACPISRPSGHSTCEFNCGEKSSVRIGAGIADRGTWGDHLECAISDRYAFMSPLRIHESDGAPVLLVHSSDGKSKHREDKRLLVQAAHLRCTDAVKQASHIRAKRRTMRG